MKAIWWMILAATAALVVGATIATQAPRGADTPMSWLQAALTDPNVVFVLLSLAVIALVTEVATPRKRLAGSFGLLLLLLAGYGMAGLPVQLPGAVLMLLAAGLFLAETMTGGVAVFAAGGAAAMCVSALVLFEQPVTVSPVTYATIAVFAALVSWLVGRYVWPKRHRTAPQPDAPTRTDSEPIR
ncbi:hypothetical protein GCM10009682_23730 [Luedemannella flava]|uniref:NfeD integral membrane domain-containing protein n=1 Tax=Luedemannella flava TaxID=349316 RepID=A0ABP4Y4G1_9ACTN